MIAGLCRDDSSVYDSIACHLFNCSDETAVDEAVARAREIVERDTESKPEKAEAEFSINTRDERFNALFEKPEYHLDPTNPNFRATEATDGTFSVNR